MDVQLFKPIVEGTLKTFKVQAGLEIKGGKPFYKGTVEQPKFALAGVIGLASSKFCGSVSLCFPEKVFLGIMGKMMGEEYTEINDELQDGAAELLNIIFGQAKATLNNSGYDLEMAIPTIVRGTELKTSAMSKKPVVVLPFETDLGEFQVEISTDSQR